MSQGSVSYEMVIILNEELDYWRERIDDILQEIKDNSVRSVAVLVGAGLSAASGISTFRGKEGLWRKYNPMQLATPMAFKKDPKLVWEWYLERMEKVANSEPNAAHYAIAEIEKKCRLETLITQNVDGLHRKAGITKFIEIHGTLCEVRCTQCSRKEEVNDRFLQSYNKGDTPTCLCGSLLRPNVVWFTEQLSYTNIALMNQAVENCDALVVVGTSGIVQPVASIPQSVHHMGKRLYEFNTEETPISVYTDSSIYCPAEVSLPYFAQQIEEICQ